MLTPLIVRKKSKVLPFDAFCRGYRPEGVSFILDSGTYRQPNQRYSYAGFDPYLEAVLDSGKLRIKTGKTQKTLPQKKLLPFLKKIFKDNRIAPPRKQPFFTGGAVGYWSYEAVQLFEKVRFRKRQSSGMPWMHLCFYRNLFVYDHQKKHYFLVALYDPRKRKGPLARTQAKTAVKKMIRMLDGKLPRRDGAGLSFSLKRLSPQMPRARFKAMVKKTKRYIADGDIYQANISQRFNLKYEGDPLVMYARLRKINPSPFAAFLNFGDLKIVSNSPERLVSKRGRLCETRPIAGTYPNKAAGKSGRVLARELVRNPKERAEHIMLVDLERNDLGRVCKWPSVRVEKMMTTERYSHVIHIVSKVVGELSGGHDAIDVLRAMFPGGTITGCPKIRCMQIIDELEPVQRGIYTGSIGHLGFDGDMDLNIVIRTLVMKKNRGFFQVGAGIVHDSDPGREYEETLHKGEAMAEALIRTSLKHGIKFDV